MAQALAAVGAEPTGGAPVSLGRHADRPVTRWRTARGDLVVKVFPSRETAVAAHAATTALWHSTFGARRDPPGLPEPVALLPGCAAVAARHVVGEVLPDDDPGALQPDLPNVALLLADLHASDCGVPHRRSGRAMVRSVHRKAADLDATPVGPAALRVAGLLQRVATDCLAPTRSLVPTHGDAAAHNLVAAAGGLRLLDWDRAAMADPARDLAYFAATLWARDVMRDRPASWSALATLVNAYARRREPPDAATLAVYLVCALVRIAHGWTEFRTSPERAAPLLTEAERLLLGLVGPGP